MDRNRKVRIHRKMVDNIIRCTDAQGRYIGKEVKTGGQKKTLSQFNKTEREKVAKKSS